MPASGSDIPAQRRRGREPLRSSSDDPAGDALAPYSSLAATPDPANVPAGDLTRAEIAPAAGGGFTVRLHVADLSAAALSQALTQSHAESLVWVWRFTNGWQDAAAVATWSAAVRPSSQRASSRRPVRSPTRGR